MSVYHQFQRLAHLLEAYDDGADLLEIIHTLITFQDSIRIGLTLLEQQEKSQFQLIWNISL